MTVDYATTNRSSSSSSASETSSLSEKNTHTRRHSLIARTARAGRFCRLVDKNRFVPWKIPAWQKVFAGKNSFATWIVKWSVKIGKKWALAFCYTLKVLSFPFTMSLKSSLHVNIKNVTIVYIYDIIASYIFAIIQSCRSTGTCITTRNLKNHNNCLHQGRM